MAEPATGRCYRHKARETLIRCGRCGRFICVKCSVQHPVGVRCPECAGLRRLPIFELSVSQYGRAILAGAGLGALTGGVLLFLDLFIPVGFFLRILLLIGVGYLVGEGISRAVNRKRGKSLQIIAAASIVLGLVVEGVALYLLGNSPLAGLPFTLLAAAVGVWVAVSRLA